jgi:hypothetical protein
MKLLPVLTMSHHKIKGFVKDSLSSVLLVFS